MRKQQGFTLIEALITLAILGIGLAGTAKLQSLVLSHMLDAKAQHEALQFTLQEIERIRYQVRYEATIPALPVQATLTGVHSQYQLEGTEITQTNTPVRTLNMNTRWQTPGTKGNLSVNTLFTDQAYSQHLYRLGY